MQENTTFNRLRDIFTSLDPGLEVKKDTPDYYYLNTNKQVNNKDMFFGAVQIRKSYVAYHLYPVYTNPELLDDLPEGLKKRMQGKSCFNFKKEITEEQLEGLRDLTKRSYQQFVENGYIEG